MSYLRFEDKADGVHVYFDGTTATGGFMEKDIAMLNRASSHSIRFLINFKRGADDVKVFVDGKKADQRHDLGELLPTPEASRWLPISKMLFRAGGTASPATVGNGFLIDNLTLTSS